MPKILSNLNRLAENNSGLLNLLQMILPLIMVAGFWVFTLWLNQNYVNRADYDADKEKAEKVFETINGKLNQIINSQTGFTTQLNGFQYSFQDLNERLKFVERKDSVRR